MCMRLTKAVSINIISDGWNKKETRLTPHFHCGPLDIILHKIGDLVIRTFKVALCSTKD